MNYKVVFYRIGNIFIVGALLMFLPAIVALIYSEGAFFSFFTPIILLLFFGWLLIRKKPEKDVIYAKEGYAIVALAWIIMSVFGALPFVISGAIPSFVDAFFETVSGFTTTGSTILAEIESLPKSILFWRSFTHFIGGMGILVFAIAIMPKSERAIMHIMRAEVPGPVVGKLVSRVHMNARVLYGIYTGMTVLLIVLLFAGGMPLFDSITNAFSVAGTGGFSVLNAGIGGYNSPYAEVVMGIFMLLFGINFSLYFLLLLGQWKRVIRDEELRWYISIITAATLVIAVVLTFTHHPFSESLRHSFFQVTSIISTTGFVSVDFELWPSVTKVILIFLMFTGSCAGSTGGAIKVTRMAILFKTCLRSIRKAFNPRSVETIKFQDKPLEEDYVTGVTGYFSAYVLIVIFSAFIVSIENKDLTTTFSAVLTCISNVGPGFGKIVGATGNFSTLSNLSKITLSFNMLAGRLELIPMFMLFSRKAMPSVSRKKRIN